jgi:hypothetical protein
MREDSAPFRAFLTLLEGAARFTWENIPETFRRKASSDTYTGGDN